MDKDLVVLGVLIGLAFIAVGGFAYWWWVARKKDRH